MSNVIELLNTNISALDDEELEVFIQALNTERSNRKKARQIAEWESLVNHIKNYCRTYGAIQIKEDVFIDEHDDYVNSGEVW